MGIFKALSSAASGTAKDQWKEFFKCDSIPADTLMVKGHRVGETGNNHGDPDVITDGSVFTVADGQAVIVTAQGKVVAECTEPGEHIYESEYSKSILSGGGLGSIFKEIGRRFAYAGDIPAVVERIYYVNTKLIPGGAFSPVTIPFRFADANTGADLDCSVTCSGSYTFRVKSPGTFYRHVAGNITGSYKTAEILRTMNAEFASVMMKTLAESTVGGKRTYELPLLIPQLEKTIREECSAKMLENWGIEIVSIAFSGMQVSGKDMASISMLQKAGVLANPAMAAGALTAATADALNQS